MGASYSSHTNLSNDCTSFEAGATGTTARWGSSFEISMGNWKENNDKTEVWGVEYQTGQKKRTCGFQLKASHDKSGGGVESIFFGLGDTTSENKTEFALNISRVGRDGLHGGITGIDSSGPPKSFTRAKQDCSIETTIVSYGCSYREGLLVLEMKKKVKCESAYMVTLAHYYVTKDVALSIAAKISRKGNGFVVKVEGPFKHPSNDLRKVLVKTCRTGIWSPGACSHCKAEKQKSRKVVVMVVVLLEMEVPIPIPIHRP
ncbi:hypothetical protein SESBI_45878 [Sesbania bispinosa]|nr:hypothetical protein SESBI_45878 [Sesbania bispinosa]